MTVIPTLVLAVIGACTPLPGPLPPVPDSPEPPDAGGGDVPLSEPDSGPSRCVIEGDLPNDLGVGLPCTADSEDCDNNEPSLFCTTDYRSPDPVGGCTFVCTKDADCGADAVCMGDPDDDDGVALCFPARCGL